ncbi:hypothetical protein [Okeania sp. SIO1I7]|uniref:hypothetical protein n=1 Tax=Okeania sp. SIO1I7 TaxID=2607772 RepID=UPI0013F8460D|nr:hypothetical protein [Okeania sp. SIO1I7]NET30240.1 hypothetical protein [Okeania sp. SIO1I7]
MAMKSLLKPIPEIDPIILLKEPYNFKESELAATLGCSIHSVASWRYNRRQPQKSIRKLAAVVQKKLDKRLRKLTY